MIRHAWLVIALSGVLVACAAPQLQKPHETANELSKASQARMEAQCGNAGQQAVDCKRRVREEFAALRKKNEQDMR